MPVKSSVKKKKQSSGSRKALKACIITEKGLESIAAHELEEYTGLKGELSERTVVFSCKEHELLLKHCYFTQAAERIIIMGAAFKLKTGSLDELLKKAKKQLSASFLKQWLVKGKDFRVSCKRIGKHDFSSLDFEKKLGEHVINQCRKELGFEPGVSMQAPETIIYAFINQNQVFIGIDLTGRELGKRHYRIFSSPAVINAKLAYALARFAGYEKANASKTALVDMHCNSGVLCIEAGLYAAGKSINYYDKDFAFRKLAMFRDTDWDAFFKKIEQEEAGSQKMSITGLDPLLRNVEACNKNAKLAGVDKKINFSKMDLEWLDTKFDKAGIDLLASRIPCPSKHTSKSAMKKYYQELFYQAEFVMKKGGKMALLSESLELLKQMITSKFKLIKESEFWSGHQRYDVVLIEKI